jgi:vacuolar-type H+-ATPase subunit H
MPTNPKSKPYDRQPNETDKSWAAFCIYRDMGRDRSAEKVRLKLGHGSRIIVERWSSKYSWVKRCSAFDDNELEKESIMLQKERLNRRLQMERDAWNRRDKLIKKADTIARVPLLRPEISEDGTQIFMPTDKWSVKDAIAFYEYSDKLGIFATGGEKPKMDVIEAINLLISLDIMPPEFAVIASQGVEQFKNLLRDLIKNAPSNDRESVSKADTETGDRDAIPFDSVMAGVAEIKPTIIPTATRNLEDILAAKTSDSIQDA